MKQNYDIGLDSPYFHITFGTVITFAGFVSERRRRKFREIDLYNKYNKSIVVYFRQNIIILVLENNNFDFYSKLYFFAMTQLFFLANIFCWQFEDICENYFCAHEQKTEKLVKLHGMSERMSKITSF